MTGTVPPAWFHALYRRRADPWGLEGSWYEDRKRDCVLAVLPAARYGRAFEPGCANGALSVRLADRCDRLVCWEPVPRAVGAARRRLAGHPHVTVGCGAVPGSWPDGCFDLVVVSELAYYLDREHRHRLWERTRQALAPGGTLVAVHWLGPAPEHPVSGDAVHDELAALDGFEAVSSYRDADFRLDVHARRPSPGDAR